MSTNFEKLAELVAEKFATYSKGRLFKVDIHGKELWTNYIASFKPGDDPIFRNPDYTSHTCNLDKSFIRRYGNVVGIVNNEKVSMWDIDLSQVDPIYHEPIKAVRDAVLNAPIKSLFIQDYDELNERLNYERINPRMTEFKLGFKSNTKLYTQAKAALFGVVEPGKEYTFYHFHGVIGKESVKTNSGSIVREYNTCVDVNKRQVEKLSIANLEFALELINDKVLPGAEIHKASLEGFIKFKKEYDAAENKELYLWGNSTYKFNNSISDFVNDLTTEEYETAVRNYLKKIDPTNYMKSTVAPSPRMVKAAADKVEELGYTESFSTRRFATLDDVKAENIQFARNSKQVSMGIFDNITTSKSDIKLDKDKVKPIHIDEFMDKILPNAKTLEVYLDNDHVSNLCTMTTGDGKPMFKWGNQFSVTVKGNIAAKSSFITQEAVKAGGKVDGQLRATLIWNEPHRPDHVDLDLHCNFDGRVSVNHHNEINYANMYQNGGTLDVDRRYPKDLGVENIVFPKLTHNGKYLIYVKNFGGECKHGFRFEILLDGVMYEYDYKQGIPSKGTVPVALVTVNNKLATIEHKLPHTQSSTKVWGLDTKQFHNCQLVCKSPNYWDGEVGRLQHLFMLEGCKSDEPTRMFHIENLNSELLAHRKTLEALGSGNKQTPGDKQLSGLAFSNASGETIIVKTNGQLFQITF